MNDIIFGDLDLSRTMNSVWKNLQMLLEVKSTESLIESLK